MKMSARVAAVGAAAAFALALTGCAFVPVESPNGEGFCDSDPVSLSVSQDTVGNNIQIDYTGPSDVSLLSHRISWYFDFEELLEASGDEVQFSVEDSEPAIVKLDPTNSGWTVSSVAGGLVNWAFDGNVDELLADVPAGYDDAGVEMFYKVFPITIAVSCDPSISSTIDYSDGNADDMVNGLEIAVAQALFPRHSSIDTVDITGQEFDADNLIIDFEFAPNTADRFYDFELGGGFVMFAPIELPEDTPEIDYDTFDGAWFNLITSCLALAGGGSPLYCNASGVFNAWTFDGTNEWVIPGASELVDGEYLGVFFLADDEDEPTDLRFAFTLFTYDSENGFEIQELDTRPSADEEKLAPTGADPNVIIYGVVGVLIAMAAIALRPRRRAAHAEE